MVCPPLVVSEASEDVLADVFADSLPVSSDKIRGEAVPQEGQGYAEASAEELPDVFSHSSKVLPQCGQWYS